MSNPPYISNRAWNTLLKFIIDEEVGKAKKCENPCKSNIACNLNIDSLNNVEKIGKSAAKKAANFIEEMSGDKVEIKVFKIGLVTPQDIKERMGDDIKVFTKITFEGKIRGIGVLIFSKESALKLSNAMLAGMGMEDEENNDEFSEMKISAINETCNLLISAYVDTIANFMNTSLTMSPPSFVVGKGKELIDEIFKSYDISDDDIVFTFESELFSHDIGAGFEVLITMPHDSICTLFHELKA